MDLVFPSNVKINDIFSIEVEQEEQRNALLVKFFCAIYRFKYNSCFKVSESVPALMNDEAQNASLGILIDNVRKNTWHKTIVDQNTVCTNDTMCFHSKRVTCVTQSQHYNHWYAGGYRSNKMGMATQ